jgi:uncharacterized SAM-binding protein YcdF (DUF218 family)
MDSRPADAQRSARRLRALALVTVVLLGLFTVLSLRLFVWPATSSTTRADAVLVFAGGSGERQAAGARLVRSGLAPVLVISDGGVRNSPSARACRQPFGLKVVCVTPLVSSTTSEARTFAALAQRERWRSVIMVTTTYHLSRARLALGRCYRGKVATATVAPTVPVPALAPKILREWAALVVAGTVQRGC